MAKIDLAAIAARAAAKQAQDPEVRRANMQEAARTSQAELDKAAIVEGMTTAEKAGVVASGALNAASMGTADELRGIMGAAEAVPRAVMNLDPSMVAEGYRTERDKVREALAAGEEYAGGLLGVGEAIGTAATAGLGVTSAAPGAAGGILRAAGRLGAQGAIQGGVEGFARGEGVEGSLEGAATGAAIGGGMGAVLGGVGTAVGDASARAAAAASAKEAAAKSAELAKRAKAAVVSALKSDDPALRKVANDIFEAIPGVKAGKAVAEYVDIINKRGALGADDVKRFEEALAAFEKPAPAAPTRWSTERAPSAPVAPQPAKAQVKFLPPVDDVPVPARAVAASPQPVAVPGAKPAPVKFLAPVDDVPVAPKPAPMPEAPAPKAAVVEAAPTAPAGPRRLSDQDARDAVLAAARELGTTDTAAVASKAGLSTSQASRVLVDAFKDPRFSGELRDIAAAARAKAAAPAVAAPPPADVVAAPQNAAMRDAASKADQLRTLAPDAGYKAAQLAATQQATKWRAMFDSLPDGPSRVAFIAKLVQDGVAPETVRKRLGIHKQAWRRMSFDRMQKAG
jgi:hypothetical protein